MSYVVEFFRMLSQAFKKSLSFIVSLPGMLATIFGSLSTSIYYIYASIRDSSVEIVGVIGDARDYVQAFVEWVQSLTFVSILYRALALDVLFQTLIVGFTFVVGLYATLLMASIVLVFIIMIPFWSYRLITKFLQLITAGIVETS